MDKESPTKHSRPKDIEEESLPFLENEMLSSLPSRHREVSGFTRNAILRWRAMYSSKFVLAHGIAFLLYTLLFIFFITRRRIGQSLHDLRLYSPAEEAVVYETKPVDGLAEGSIYAGYPRPESEAAWNALMEGTNIKIYPDEMLRLKETSLEMRDGSGSLGVLGVYHELHCVKRLRKWFYKEHYYPNQTDVEFNERMTHAEHCLEFIRQAAMCHGDITVTSFKWLHDPNGHVVEPTTKEGALHRCVRWESISSWTKSRRVDLFDPELLAPEMAHHV